MEDKSLKVAVLYQAQQPPVQNGIRKPMKPGGYSDSGADIAYTLKQHQVNIITPVNHPDTNTDLDWVFPDTHKGIEQAISAGANCLWLNTVLYQGHPIENFKDVWLVGQLPSAVERYDDKWYTNNLLKQHGLPIPKAELVNYHLFKEVKLNIEFPVVAKPIRGRGSEGVTLIHTATEYETVLTQMFAEDRFGTEVYVEEYLPGQEITITVMPAGNYVVNGQSLHQQTPWCLPGVIRFNHQNGVAPYNGTVAVVHNSSVLSDEEEASNTIQQLYRQCETASALVDLKAPIRIDCRANAQGQYFLFDLNMKPNMTGPSRHHRRDQDSLTALAARKIGWSFADLLVNMLHQAWMF
ncbi:ATP-grasp domain-containing protein [Mucilaginibacter robiniae]|uniref:ATP-grasp domain-containing protein n=1 Tax=Mucilaginibacter robiniae TaxID=2728022 RepID=A0A7L5DX32_9SPHI|nr:ATP-grasp domain-containing protein [Mucilaginibacter robiniae]QJD95311.1 ATP-grasp domain-containing protein [Mucilaginibacter robiniae]